MRANITVSYWRYASTPAGLKINKYHRSLAQWWDGNTHPKPHQFGGRTMIQIVVDDKFGAYGLSVCSLSDAFCYQTGRALAATRLDSIIEQIPEFVEAENMDDIRLILRGWSTQLPSDLTNST